MISPSASVSPSPSPAFEPPQSNVIAIQQADDITITTPKPTDITVID